jgi:anti-sigma factor RsiW
MTANPECRTLLAEISAYLDGELDAAACDVIERHCLACCDCAAIVDGLRETVGLCRKAASMPLPDEVRQRARDRIRRLLAAEDTP